MKSTTTPKILNVTADVARLEILRKEAAELEQKIRLARGTGDLTEQARVARGEPAPLAVRIETHLRAKPHTLDELARELREPVGRVSTALRPLKKNLFNVGTTEAPVWFWIVGDDGPTDQLNAAVTALVAYRPMWFAELMAATRARYGRVSGALVALRRDPKSRLVDVNQGAGGKARWWIVPEGIQIARLKSH